MKRYIFILLSFITGVGGMSAQSITSARTILDKTAEVVGNAGGASASFAYSGANGSAEGTITIKGNMFKAVMPQATVWYDGKIQWTYMKSTEEVSISTPSDTQQQSMNPYNFINLYKKGYDLTSKKSGSNHEIHLTAQTGSGRQIKEMYVTVNSNYQPVKVKMLTDKGWSTITISGFKTGNYADTYFRFDAKAYPEAEVIDLR